MAQITIQALEPEERDRLRGSKGAGFLVAAFVVAVPVVLCGLAFLLYPVQHPLTVLGSLAAIAVLASCCVFLVFFMDDLKLARDLQRNQKVVLHTTVARLEEEHFRDISSHYLLIPAADAQARRRHFQIDAAMYGRLAQGDRIRLAFAPVSGKVLSIARIAGDAESCGQS
jgi:hypothetical protein